MNSSGPRRVSTVSGGFCSCALVFSVCVFILLLLFGCRSTYFLIVRQLPRLFEQRLFRAVEAEENLEFGRWACGDPVRLLAGRGGGAEIDFDRSIVVHLEPRVLRRSARARHVADEAMGR